MFSDVRCFELVNDGRGSRVDGEHAKHECGGIIYLGGEGEAHAAHPGLFDPENANEQF